MIHLARLVVLVIVALAAPSGVLAHEFGALRVDLLLHADGTIQGELHPDAEHLRVPAGIGASDPGFGATLLGAATLRADGVPVSLTPAEPAPPGGSAGRTVIAFSTRVPAGTETLAWSHAWPAGASFVRVRLGEREDVLTAWLRDDREAVFDVRGGVPVPPLMTTLRTYLALGFTHIVPHGTDHVLFVLGLYFMAQRPGALLAQVTAFTVAHSLTLALAMLGLAALPGRVAEPLIALSIALVAAENIASPVSGARRTALVFAFGLLHGLGFAGVLSELGVPRGQFVAALAAFNAGVEFGQLAVIGAAFLVLGGWWRSRGWYRGRVAIPASVAIGAVGLYWTLERIAGGA